MHANFGGRRLRDNDLGTLKPTKNGYFWAEIFYFAYNKKNAQRGKLQFGHNMGRGRKCLRTKFEGSQSRDRSFWGGKWTKSGKFWSGISR